MIGRGLIRLGLIAVLCAGAATGCGDDGASGPKGFAGEEKTVMVKAAEGGLVATGSAKLMVPAGALAADTAITVAVTDKQSHPAADTIALDVYDFGPDGTTFSKPVPLEFDLSGVDLKNKRADIAWLDDSGKWNKLTDSATNGGKITATTTHFTPFTVILTVTDDGKIGQTGGQCGSTFTACGGDIVGTWKYTGACLTLPDTGLPGSGDGNPFSACSDKPVVAVTLDLTGTASFKADGTFNVNQMSTSSFEIKVPNKCIEQVGMGMITCAQLDGKPSGDYCVMSEEPDMETDMSSGTYTVSGSKLTVMDSGTSPDPDEDAEFCVKGNTLTVRLNTGEGTVVHYTATRE